MIMRVALCIPCYSYIPSSFLLNIIQTIIENIKKKYVLEVLIQMDFPVDKARNELVESALAKNVDYIWFIDTDNLMSPDTLERMIETIEQTGADIVTALYFEKAKPYYPVLRQYHTDGFWKVENPPLGEVIEVDGCGMGCCLIKPDVFKKLSKPWFAFSYEDWHGKSVQLSEDLYFCRKARQAGFKIVCNTGIISTHIGGGIDAFEYESFREIRESVYNDREEFINDVMEFTNQTREEVIIKMYKGPMLMVQEWNEKSPKTDEEVKKFYKETKNYVYDLGYWHFGDRRQFDVELVTSCKEIFKPKKILDFGAGIGQNAYMLAREGFDVTVADLDSYTLDFAEWRFKKHNVPAKFWKVDKEDIEEKFDLILCFDVLEHLSEDEFKKVVEKLISLKAENCKVLVTTAFGKTDAHPMHFDVDEEKMDLIKKLLS